MSWRGQSGWTLGRSREAAQLRSSGGWGLDHWVTPLSAGFLPQHGFECSLEKPVMSLPAARQMVAGRGRAAAQAGDARQSRGPWEDPCDLQVVLGAHRHSAVFRRILVHADGPRAMSQYRWSTLALVASSPQTVTSSWVLSSCCGWESRP